jgi:FHA domain-containing protein
MSFLRKIEQTLDTRLRGIFGGRQDEPGSREAIELYRDALDQIAARAIVGKRGERVFPFNAIQIELGAADGERRTVLEALFEPVQLLADVREALAGERASVPAELTVRVVYPAEALVDLRVVCEKAVPVAAVEELAQPVVQNEPNPLIPVLLRTMVGVSSEPAFIANKAHINIGREQDVVDTQGRAVRRNDLWFAEGADEANATVSRTHAHVRFEAGSGEWRIYDDGSSFGTYIFRAGRRIDVPGHSPRGVMLLPGDEIYLGQVRVRLEIC